MSKGFIWGSEEGASEAPSSNNNEPISLWLGEGAVSRSANRIFFYRDIDQKSMHDLVEKIHEVEAECISTASEWDIEIPAIHLHINSFGGEVYAALAALDHIRACRAPVYTYINGAAASAATMLSIAGTKRYMYPNAYMLIHQLSSGFWGKYEEIKDEIVNLDGLMEHTRNIYRRYTQVPEKDLKSILKRDIWLSAEHCLKWGLVDEIMGPEQPPVRKPTKKSPKKRSKKA